MTLYVDDPDVYADFEIRDADGGDNDWTPVLVQSGDDELAGTWRGDPGATRTLRVPLFGLTVGGHDLRLVVPGGNDVSLGRVWLYAP